MNEEPVMNAVSDSPADAPLPYYPGVTTLTQPKVPEAKIRGSQEDFQWVILGLERVSRVLKWVQRGPTTK